MMGKWTWTTQRIALELLCDWEGKCLLFYFKVDLTVYGLLETTVCSSWSAPFGAHSETIFPNLS